MARIAVIGAGMGGMAAAARLAVAGHEVVVHERTDTYGGALRRFTRDGFSFDTGPGLLHLPAVQRDLFVKTGRAALEDRVGLVQVPVTARHVFPDGSAVTLPNAARGKVVDALDEALGAGAGERWSELLGRAREVWEAVRRPLLEEPLRDEPGSRGALVRDDALPVRPRRRGLLRLPRSLRPGRAPALAALADGELRDPRLAALLGSCAWAHGLDPATAPASAIVLPYIEDTFGTWYVRGGMRNLAQALYERCRERHVEFRFGTRVTEVRERDGRAAGVGPLADGAGEADAVVVGGVAGAPGGVAGGELGTARLTVLLALRGAPDDNTAHRTVVHRDLGGAGRAPVTVLQPDDPALRPEGDFGTAVLSVPVPVGSLRTQAEAERLADELLATVDAAGLGLGPRVLWREVRTPTDTEAETGTPGGRVPPPALPGAGGAFLHPANHPAGSAPLPGLYAAGGWSHPGGGLAAAGMTGAMVAGLVQDPEWRGSR
ncbi:phytoene desaturase family protein [Streptomyces cacaoi]|uniref:phytoene desaturase family protein n=1 Tax=Streptomyces cacaoi TaxID=1898 RepID=UPI0011F238EC|nr:NAD(P)/FAD-dependent oxidoreductase [Streptomyces cacaoi]